MEKLWIPDGSASRAVLIGVPEYRSSELADIPAVWDNLVALHKVLTGHQGLFPADHCQVLGGRGQPLDKTTLGTSLITARREAADLLLVYYAGHGLLDDDGHLHLALPESEPGNVAYSGVPLELVKRELARARASSRVLLLDCCFSGRAVAAMSTPGSLVAGQLDLTGTFTLTSTTATAPSHAPPGARYTAFTEALLGALNAAGPLSLDDIYTYVDRDLVGRGLPRPQCRSVNAARNLTLVRGPIAVRNEDATRSDEEAQKPAGPAQVRFAKQTSRARRRRAAILSALMALPTAGLCYFVSFDFSHRSGALFALLPLLLITLGLVAIAREVPLSLVVDGTGLALEIGDASNRFFWDEIDYLGVLREFTFLEGGGMGRSSVTVKQVLVIRLRQTAPRPSSRLLRADYRQLRDLGYIGLCQLSDIDADPVWLRQAVEHLGGPMFRSDRELRDLDPRLAPDAP